MERLPLEWGDSTGLAFLFSRCHPGTLFQRNTVYSDSELGCCWVYVTSLGHTGFLSHHLLPSTWGSIVLSFISHGILIIHFMTWKKNNFKIIGRMFQVGKDAFLFFFFSLFRLHSSFLIIVYFCGPDYSTNNRRGLADTCFFTHL